MAEVFTLDKGDLEEALDQAKAVVLVSMVNEGLLPIDVAEEWASTHTIVLKKKGFFRTLTDRWKKTDEIEGHLMFVVSNPYLKYNLPPAGDGDGVSGNRLMSILDKVKKDNPDLADKDPENEED